MTTWDSPLMPRRMDKAGYRYDTEGDSSKPVNASKKPICILPDDEKQTYMSFCSM